MKINMSFIANFKLWWQKTLTSHNWGSNSNTKVTESLERAKLEFEFWIRLFDGERKLWWHCLYRTEISQTFYPLQIGIRDFSCQQRKSSSSSHFANNLVNKLWGSEKLLEVHRWNEDFIFFIECSKFNFNLNWWQYIFKKIIIFAASI